MLTRVLQRNFSSAATFAPVQLKPLPFALGALEPIMSGHMLEFHYGKHHRAYVNNLTNTQYMKPSAYFGGGQLLLNAPRTFMLSAHIRLKHQVALAP